MNYLLLFFIELLIFSASGQPSENMSEPDKNISNLSIDDSMNDYAIYLPLIAIIVSVTLYGYSKRREKWNLLQTAYETIFDELSINKKDFKNSGKYQIVTRNLDKKDRVEYTNAFFDTFAFDSVTKGGFFIHLHKELQPLLSNVYSRIKGHNQYLEYVDRLTDEFILSTQTDPEILEDIKLKYEILITKYEDEILKFISDIETIINQERGKSFLLFIILFWMVDS